MINFMDSLSSVLSLIVGEVGIEILSYTVISIALINIVRVVYRVAKNGYADKDGKELVGIGICLGILKMLPKTLKYVRFLIGV